MNLRFRRIIRGRNLAARLDHKFEITMEETLINLEFIALI